MADMGNDQAAALTVERVVAVAVQAELTEIAPNGKMLTFKVAAYDEAGLIGEGTHQRAIVAKERFEQKAQSKLSK